MITEEITVKEAISLLNPYIKYIVYGAKTGHKLFDSLNSDKVKSKYMDCKVCEVGGVFTPQILLTDKNRAIAVITFSVSGY